MIKKLITSKALPWVVGAAGAFILALTGALFYMHHQNGQLNERVGDLRQENESLSETARRMSKDYETLQQEVARRDELVSQAMEEKQVIEGNAHETIKELRAALETDMCAARPHPDAVADSLRPSAGDRVQD